MLKFYNADLKFVAEPGDFDVMIGPDSRNVKNSTVYIALNRIHKGIEKNKIHHRVTQSSIEMIFS